jgi:DNA mismatch endonuclease (patch repair protein)
LTPLERSARMSLVRSSGNRSTEQAVAARLGSEGILGWERHPTGIIGKPDFYFPAQRVVVFVDGCFWHACPICKRRIPTRRSEFWGTKIDETRRRDNRLFNVN